MKTRETAPIQNVITRFMRVTYRSLFTSQLKSFTLQLKSTSQRKLGSPQPIAKKTPAFAGAWNNNEVQHKQRGNAMIYVLIALALFGFLTMTLSRSNDQADGQDIDDEQAELYALELIAYASSARQAVDIMLTSGSDLDELDFITPDDAGFNTTPPPNYHKLFHPQGGGISHQETFSEAIQNGAGAAWHINTNIDVEWTPEDSTGNPIDDVILTAYFVTRQVCETINEKITGSSTIPATLSPHSDYFLDTGNTDLDSTECAGCVGRDTLCVENNTNNNFSFYSIIAAQ